MHPILEVLLVALQLYQWIVIIFVIMSWLIAFNVVNSRNQFVYTVGTALTRLTEPVLAPIRRIMPSLGGIDLSPIVLLLALFFAQRMIIYYGTPGLG